MGKPPVLLVQHHSRCKTRRSITHIVSIYMDVLISKLKRSGHGCRLFGEFYGCIVYADDIMLLSHSLNAMQLMLKICDDFAIDYDLKFNTEKSVAMRIGARHNVVCEPLNLAGKKLQFVQSLKNFGVFVVSARYFKCTVDHSKVKFYRIFNCLYSRSKAANSEIVTVELMKSYRLPLILFATEAVSVCN